MSTNTIAHSVKLKVLAWHSGLTSAGLAILQSLTPSLPLRQPLNKDHYRPSELRHAHASRPFAEEPLGAAAALLEESLGSGHSDDSHVAAARCSFQGSFGFCSGGTVGRSG